MKSSGCSQSGVITVAPTLIHPYLYLPRSACCERSYCVNERFTERRFTFIVTMCDDAQEMKCCYVWFVLLSECVAQIQSLDSFRIFQNRSTINVFCYIISLHIGMWC